MADNYIVAEEEAGKKNEEVYISEPVDNLQSFASEIEDEIRVVPTPESPEPKPDVLVDSEEDVNVVNMEERKESSERIRNSGLEDIRERESNNEVEAVSNIKDIEDVNNRGDEDIREEEIDNKDRGSGNLEGGIMPNIEEEAMNSKVVEGEEEIDTNTNTNTNINTNVNTNVDKHESEKSKDLVENKIVFHRSFEESETTLFPPRPAQMESGSMTPPIELEEEEEPTSYIIPPILSNSPVIIGEEEETPDEESKIVDEALSKTSPVVGEEKVVEGANMKGEEVHGISVGVEGKDSEEGNKEGKVHKVHETEKRGGKDGQKKNNPKLRNNTQPEQHSGSCCTIQ